MTTNKEHVVCFSGGIGSWGAAMRVRDQFGIDGLRLVFTDTLIEDEDLYRFLIQAAAIVFDVPQKDVAQLSSRCVDIPTLEHGELEERKSFLAELREDTKKVLPNLFWLAEGRTPWEVFHDKRFIGNSRIDPCSRVLKREFLDEWIEDNYDPEDVTIYVGIDWSEIHRYERMAPRKLPYIYEAPLTLPPYIKKEDLFSRLSDEDVDVPRLYKMGFSHNNCGGFCVKAGQGHFKTLNDSMPERYKYHEEKEKEMQEYLERDVTILKKSVDGEAQFFSMEDLRLEVESGSCNIDMFDIGGCGCFLDYGDKDD